VTDIFGFPHTAFQLIAVARANAGRAPIDRSFLVAPATQKMLRRHCRRVKLKEPGSNHKQIPQHHRRRARQRCELDGRHVACRVAIGVIGQRAGDIRVTVGYGNSILFHTMMPRCGNLLALIGH
jgi:hypothetical protein